MGCAMAVVINGIEYVPRINLRHIEGDSFGTALRNMRKQAKLSLDAAAVQIGCSKSHLWDLEHDKAEPGLRLAYRIASAYGVPLATLAACLNMAA